MKGIPVARSGRARVATFVLLSAVLAAVTSTPALAASAEPALVRFAQFSPDAGVLAASVSSSGSTAPVLQQQVPSASVSAYAPLPAGSYSVRFDSPAGGAPLISGGLDLVAGEAVTVAAIGPVGRIQNVVLDDDLSSPAPGRAAVRVVNAAAITTPVDVSSEDVSLLSGAVLGDAGDRVEVDPGVLPLALVSAGITDTVEVDVAPGAVTSLFVVADAQGALSIVPVVDAAGVGEPPVGGVATGGGFLASPGVGIGIAITAVLLLIVAIGRRLAPRRAQDRT